jgi:signal transduction histidine kinase
MMEVQGHVSSPHRAWWKGALIIGGYVLGAIFVLVAAAAAAANLMGHHWGDILDPATDAVVGGFGFLMLAITWFRRGWLGVREAVSYEAYALKRKCEDYEKFSQAIVDFQTAATRARQRGKEARAVEFDRRAEEARERARQAGVSLLEAAQKLQARFPEDAELGRTVDSVHGLSTAKISLAIDFGGTNPRHLPPPN